jgi:NDP-sugar pyrophosphorylase family protein/lipopolysaccharide/colanic/teichoic acid biosynthesis glycosyltransferase
LLTVVNRPVIEHLLEMLVRHGVESATLAMHHYPYPVEACLGEGTRLGLRLEYALERAPLGTAGSARRIAASWTEPFVLAAGTALVPADLAKAAAFHRAHDAALTLLVKPTTAADGVLDLTDDSRVLLPRLPRTGSFGVAGLAVVSPSALRLLPRLDRPADLVADLLPRLLEARLPVYGQVTRGPGGVIRTLAELLQANQRALAGELPGLVLPGVEIERGIRVCRGASIHPRARLFPPVLVGTNAVVGRDALLASAVIGDEAIVDGASTIRQSVVTARTHVGGGLRLEDAVVTPDGVGLAQPTTWIDVRDPCLLVNTRTPVLAASRNLLLGNLFAALMLGATTPMWGLILLGLLLETRGRPFHRREVVGARGWPVKLRSFAVRGPFGRMLSRWGCKRLPYLWSILRGDLQWVGTTPRSPAEVDALRARGELDLAPPGLVTLAHFTPSRLQRDGRLALDRLYTEMQTRALDLRLLAATARNRAGVGIRVKTSSGAVAS